MRLRRPRRAKLRTRVLFGVLGVTLVALVAFDVAAVTALRGYLLSQTDQQLREVLSLYRVLPVHQAGQSKQLRKSFVPRQEVKGNPLQQITGPRAILPGALGQFDVVTVNHSRPLLSIMGGSQLLPRMPLPNLAELASSHTAVTLKGQDGTTQIRLMVVSFPGYGLVYATTSLSGMQRTLGQLELILIIGSAAAGAIAAGGVAWVMRRGLRPVEVMASQADKINAGDLTDRVSPHDPRTEMGRLSAALNGMLARIEDFVAEREASQEATRRFFADASHELRNPLASLRANAELYQQGALSSRPQVDQAMHRIAAEAQRMSSLVDDMLRLARLDQHPGQEHEPVDLTALVQDCVERAQVTGAERAWHSHVAPGLTVNGDAELLRRAVDNLLANVRAHTAAGTTATITATGSADLVTVEVSDDGPGVPAGQLPHIFDRFYRAGPQAHRPGSGLGLAVVAAVAAAHEGTAGAALNDPHGLRITLTLPGRPEPDPGPAGPQASAGEGGERPAEPGQPAVTGAGRARPSPAPRPCRAAAAGSPRGSSAWPGR
jgi:two-component system, OmpR family, sensor kinase